MNVVKNYLDTKIELDSLEKRLELILIYEEKLLHEKESVLNIIQKQKKALLCIENNLKNLSGIEYKLYYEIAVKGTNITRAVEKIAFEEEKDVSTIWKNYYPKIKKLLNQKLRGDEESERN